MGDGPPGGLQTASREALRRGVQTYSISYEKEFTQKSLNVRKVVQEIVRIGSSFIVFWGFLWFSPTFPGSESNECLEADLSHASGVV